MIRQLASGVQYFLMMNQVTTSIGLPDVRSMRIGICAYDLPAADRLAPPLAGAGWAA